MSEVRRRRQLLALLLKCLGSSVVLGSGVLLSSCAMRSTKSPLDLSLTKSLDGISLDVKVGQMLLAGFRGLKVDGMNDAVIRDIQQHHLGGVLLYDFDVATMQQVRNIQSPAQVKALTGDLQRYSDIPLFIGIDYEGGLVNRLPETLGFPATFSHKFLGLKNNLAFTREQAHEMAKTLARLGINLNFAPCVDVNVNPNNPIIAEKERFFCGTRASR